MFSSLDNGESLPTIAEIKSSSTVLTKKDSWRQHIVVRVRDKFAVKSGWDESLLIEAETMQFILAHTNVPIPRVFGILVEDNTWNNGTVAKRYHIVMEYIAGGSYLEELPSLTPTEKADIWRQLRQAMDELRALPSPGYYGQVGCRQLYDTIFAHPESQGEAMCGPFATEEKLNHGIGLLMDRLLNRYHAALFRQSIDAAYQGHRPTFTHGDLQDRNLLIRPVGFQENGDRCFKVILIDWEYAGWYPDYWEFCVISCYNNGKSEWMELIHAVLDMYAKEYPMMFLLRETIKNSY